MSGARVRNVHPVPQLLPNVRKLSKDPIMRNAIDPPTARRIVLSVLQAILTVVAGILGFIVGGLVGLFGLMYVCWLHDVITQPPPGGGLIAVGWIFAYFTVPAGAIGFTYLFAKFVWSIFDRAIARLPTHQAQSDRAVSLHELPYARPVGRKR
jgi:hypothetical protein